MKVYDRAAGRLICYEESATADFWDEHWDIANFRESIERGRNNRFCLNTLKKYITDKKEPVLEGGCGAGYIVYCMHSHGYRAIGVDTAEKTIGRLNSVFPELDVRVADVRSLPFPDAYFAGYWSLGVIEHFRDGYHDVLREMHRVLKDGGYVFLTFPCMSPLRRLKVRFTKYEEFHEDIKQEDDFYQFILDADRVKNDLKAAGFEPVACRNEDGIKGFKDEVSIFRRLLQAIYDYRGKNLAILGLRLVLDRLLATFAGHLMFMVFKKVA